MAVISNLAANLLQVIVSLLTLLGLIAQRCGTNPLIMQSNKIDIYILIRHDKERGIL